MLPFSGSLLSNKAVNTTISLPILTLTSYLLADLHWKRWYPWWNWVLCSVVLGFFKWRIKTPRDQNCLLPREAESFCWEDKHSVPLTSGCRDCWHRVRGPFAIVRPWGHLAREVCDKTSLWDCCVPLAAQWWAWEGNAVLAGESKANAAIQRRTGSVGEWELMTILCGAWVKQFLQTLLYSFQNKEFWCCFGLAFNGIVIEKTSVYKQSLISWKQRSNNTVRGNSQTCHL